MIAISTDTGKLIKVIGPQSDGARFGFHSLFGFISEQASHSRARARDKKGLRNDESWLCDFEVRGQDIRALSNCKIERKNKGQWELITQFGKFVISELTQDLTAGTPAFDRSVKSQDQTRQRSFELSLLLSALIIASVFLLLRKPIQEVAPLVISEPVEVKMVKETQKAVQISNSALPKELAKQITDHKAKVAVAQNLGFLSMLGRKDLTKALGGMPTIADASAGAGAGGKQGSGGELLVGLGQGVTRTTVGNSGVAGLGGIGTKGAGGGGGGYGTSSVGSGNGRALSSIPLSQEMVLEGGLDRSVIQATIAKYLNQVRACYEEGLRQSPGLVGQVTMNFVIGGTGAVRSAHVGKTTLGNAGVENCISAKMLGWEFPKPRGGVDVKVNYPFLLRPVKS